VLLFVKTSLLAGNKSPVSKTKTAILVKKEGSFLKHLVKNIKKGRKN
jgi:hypothetical protein